MSKDQENILMLPVETVEKFRNYAEYICITISFWKLRNVFPYNLIFEVSKEMFEEYKKYINIIYEENEINGNM